MAHARPSGGDQVLQVKHANDLVSVMQEYVTLQRAGRNYKVCCPFHESKRGGRERTPSLHVYPDKQWWYCFGAGCGRGGSVIDFVMEYEGLDFLGALKRLAERAGIQLEQRKRKQRNPGEVERDGLYKLLREAQAIYREAYPNSAAEAYVRSRGIADEVAERFGLGYAPQGWETTKQRLNKRWDERALLQAGLLSSAANDPKRTYDFFRNRLTIPIRDAQGTLLGFGARALAADEKAKYINSPATELYDKSSVLFGVDLAREAIRKTRRAIIMEGYTDVMLAHQFGVEHCVAPCGTALTAQHLPLLRQADKLTLLFDGDTPGIGAAERTLTVLLPQGVEAEIVILPDELDPADFLVRHGGEAFQAFLEERPRTPVEFKLDVLRGRFDFQEPLARAKAVQECLELVAVCESAVVREGLIERFAEGFKLPVSALRDEFAERFLRHPRRRGEQGKPGGKPYKQPRGKRHKGSRAGSYGRAASTELVEDESYEVELAAHRREEIALMCSLVEPDLATEFEREFGVTSLPDGPLRDIADWLLRLASRPGPLDKATFASDVMSMLEPPARVLLVQRLAVHLGKGYEFDPSGVTAERAATGEKEVTDDDRLARDAPTVREVFAECVAAAAAHRARLEATQVRRDLALEGVVPGETSREALLKHLEVQRMRATPRRNASPDAS